MTYAELYERITEAAKTRQNVVLDIDEGTFLMTPEQALETWDNLAPGQGVEWIEPGTETAQRAIDLTIYEEN